MDTNIKYCSTCGIGYPDNTEFFRRKGSYMSRQCIGCEKKARTKRDLKIREAKSHHLCMGCQKTLPWDADHFILKANGKLSYKCRNCIKWVNFSVSSAVEAQPQPKKYKMFL